MGQPISVTQKSTRARGVIRFELNRSVTGMDHERYATAPEPARNRPPDELARRIFAQGDVSGISMYSNEVTVQLVPHGSAAGLREIIEDLYIHYTPGVMPSLP